MEIILGYLGIGLCLSLVVLLAGWRDIVIGEHFVMFLVVFTIWPVIIIRMVYRKPF